jgi:hypothetical protein
LFRGYSAEASAEFNVSLDPRGEGAERLVEKIVEESTGREFAAPKPAVTVLFSVIFETSSPLRGLETRMVEKPTFRVVVPAASGFTVGARDDAQQPAASRAVTIAKNKRLSRGMFGQYSEGDTRD